MSDKQKLQFNQMLAMLQRLSKGYQTPAQLRKSAKGMGLDYDEMLEMAYENIQSDAASTIKGVRAIP
jgi:hypothetical protein